MHNAEKLLSVYFGAAQKCVILVDLEKDCKVFCEYENRLQYSR